MATNDTIIRAPVDTAGDSAEFRVDQYPVKVGLYPIADLVAGEFADLQEEDPAGAFGDVSDPFYQGSGAQVRLSTLATDFIITATGNYKLVFDNPTNAVGAFIRTVRTLKT